MKLDKETVKYIEEHQKYVKGSMEEVFANPLREIWQGDYPISAFDGNGLFTEENWNDTRINLLRGFFAGWFHNGISDEIVFIGNLEICHFWDDDQNYVFMRDVETDILYYITWYKSRGRTDLILRNGKPISLPEFKQLLLDMLQPLREPIW